MSAHGRLGGMQRLRGCNVTAQARMALSGGRRSLDINTTAQGISFFNINQYLIILLYINQPVILDPHPISAQKNNNL